MTAQFRFFLFTICYTQLFWLGHLSSRQKDYAKEFALAEQPLTAINYLLSMQVDANMSKINKTADAYAFPQVDSMRNVAVQYCQFMEKGVSAYLKDSMINLTARFMRDSLPVVEHFVTEIQAVEQLPESSFFYQTVYEKLRRQLDTCHRRSSEVWFTQQTAELLSMVETTDFDSIMLGFSTEPGELHAGDTWKGELLVWHYFKNPDNVRITINDKEVKAFGGLATDFLIAKRGMNQAALLFSVINPLTTELKTYKILLQYPKIID